MIREGQLNSCDGRLSIVRAIVHVVVEYICCNHKVRHNPLSAVHRQDKYRRYLP